MIKKMQVFNTESTSYSQFLQTDSTLISSVDYSDSLIDISFFQRSISKHYENAYRLKMRESWIYRMIFFGFGIFFAFLAILIYFKTTNFVCSIYFNNSFFVKNFVNFFCLILASSAFAIGYIIQPEREAIYHLVGKVERQFSDTAKRWQNEVNSIFQSFADEWTASHEWNHSQIRTKNAFGMR